MTALRAKDIEKVVEISNLAQDCAEETQLPPALLQQMSDLLSSKSAVFYSMGDNLRKHPLWNGVGLHIDSARVNQYGDFYNSVDPCFNGLRERAGRHQPLIISTDQAIENDRRYVGSEYYQDFLKPQDIHSSIIFAVGDQQGMLGLFGFHRSVKRPHYSAEDHLKARLLASQVAAGLRLSQITNSLFRSQSIARKLMSQASVKDYLVIDRRFRLVECAGNATSSLGLAVNNTLFLEDSEASIEKHLPVEVRDYLTSLTAPGPDRLDHDNLLRSFDSLPGNIRIRVDILESDPQNPLFLLVFLNDDSALVSESRLSHFALTPRERDIVHQICRGLTTAQVANQLSISIKTVEHHMTHIYAKTQTHNRTGLIRQLAS